jgi:hypothetical protein
VYGGRGSGVFSVYVRRPFFLTRKPQGVVIPLAAEFFSDNYWVIIPIKRDY